MRRLSLAFAAALFACGGSDPVVPPPVQPPPPDRCAEPIGGPDQAGEVVELCHHDQNATSANGLMPFENGVMLQTEEGLQGLYHIETSLRYYALTGEYWGYEARLLDRNGQELAFRAYLGRTCPGWNIEPTFLVFVDTPTTAEVTLRIEGGPKDETPHVMFERSATLLAPPPPR
jgi:hypothetical protein